MKVDRGEFDTVGCTSVDQVPDVDGKGRAPIEGRSEIPESSERARGPGWTTPRARLDLRLGDGCPRLRAVHFYARGS
jgi:hypothetical protein